jgi:two-component system, LytTR family, response regulator
MDTNNGLLGAVLVDPDASARRHLRDLLDAESGIEVVAECDGAATARPLIHRECPDLLFLDVTLPDSDGFSLVRELAPCIGGVVFVTAHPHGALEAYDLHALGYLLKPVADGRLRAMAAHVRSLLSPTRRETGAIQQMVALLDRRDAERRRQARLLVRHPDGAFFLRTECIDWIEAAGKQVRVHAGKQVHEQRAALTHVEQQLSPDQFVRVSRSAIVNIDRIREIQPWFNGDFLVILDDDSQVPSSRHFRANLHSLLGRNGHPT